MQSFVSKTLRAVHAAEEGVLALLLLSMIALASADIFLRMFTGGGLVWVSPLIRIMVLWLGLLGALLATRDNQHISIDILSRVLGDAVRRWAQAFTSLFAAAVCGVTAWHSVEFVQGSFEYQDEVMSGVPAWPMQVVIPLSFAMMSLRFALHSAGYVFVKNYRKLATTQEAEA